MQGGNAPPPEALKAYLLLCLDRNVEAIAILRSTDPQIFAEPPPMLYPGRVGQNALVGLALLRTGAADHGRTLLQQIVKLLADRPGNRSIWYMAWWDVVAYSDLGDKDKAIAALRDGIAAGTVLDIAVLDRHPLLRDLRADPRYESTVAPARARAAAQVAAAVEAGLLPRI